jgi:Mn-dependent DtxR family transcriptional regulator
MNLDAMVLRAMLRLARRREAAVEEALAVRVGGSPGDVRAAVRRLSARGLVDGDGALPRLTMEGLVLAVALLPARTTRSPRRSPAPARASRAA